MSHDHTHLNPADQSADGERRLYFAMLLTGGFMLAEVIGGLLSGSLALLADAGHMFGDFVALALAWAAFRVGKKSPDLRRSFGYHRFQVLAAFVNGIALLGIAAWILITALGRLLAPHAVLAGPMLVIATLGLIVNLVVFRMLTGAKDTNLNLRAAALHVMGDLLGSIAAIGAAFIIEEVDPGQVSEQLMTRIPEITDIHHVHIWSLTDVRPVLTLHARVAEDVEHDRIMSEIHQALESLFGVSHATVQLEYGPCTDELKDH